MAVSSDTLTDDLTAVLGLDDADLASFETAHPSEILRWAGERFGEDLVVTASFGDAVLAHLVSRALPDAEIILLDTGYLFAETMWFAEQLRDELGINLRIVGPPPDAEPNLWQRDTTACCAVRKVAPLAEVLAGKRAWVTGLRRADSPTRAEAPIVHYDALRDVIKINPLATWTDAQVDHYRAVELLPENPLTELGYPSIGCWPCTRPVREGDDPRAGRWAGSDKTECGLHE